MLAISFAGWAGQRVAKPEETARGVRSFAVEGDYMTGQSLNINGGIYMGW